MYFSLKAHFKLLNKFRLNSKTCCRWFQHDNGNAKYKSISEKLDEIFNKRGVGNDKTNSISGAEKPSNLYRATIKWERNYHEITFDSCADPFTCRLYVQIFFCVKIHRNSPNIVISLALLNIGLYQFQFSSSTVVIALVFLKSNWTIIITLGDFLGNTHLVCFLKLKQPHPGTANSRDNRSFYH